MKINSKVIILMTFVCFAFFACKKNKNNNNNQTVTTQDQTFMSQASLGNTAEIQAGGLADSTADSAAVRTFGMQMVTDHTTAQNDLKKLGNNLNIPVVDSVDSMHAALMDTLRGVSGRMFDSVYIMNQIKDHQAAISNFQAEIGDGNQASVINYANQYLPKLQMHLQMADSIATAMKFK